MLWVGIDEAGYGPNLGPLVMTAVIAEGPDDHPPDPWLDLAATVSRVGGPAGSLWVDDSKRVFHARQGRPRLDAACLAAVASGAPGTTRPASFGSLLAAVGAGSLDAVELAPWLAPGSDPPVATEGPGFPSSVDPFAGASWRIVAVRSAVVGPARFNAGIDATGSKASVHFAAFAGLLAKVWRRLGPDRPATVVSDKHGGRHFYADPLRSAFPSARVHRGVEGPELSAYTLTSDDPERRLDLRLLPRADAGHGLVAIASVVSKSIRERWMDAFNAHWLALIPGLKPTAGYPVDAARFRAAIEPICLERGRPPATWWRSR